MLFDTLLSQIVGFGAYSSTCSGNKRKALSSEDRGISSCCCVYGSNTGRLKPRRCFACSSLQEAWLLFAFLSGICRWPLVQSTLVLSFLQRAWLSIFHPWSGLHQSALLCFLCCTSLHVCGRSAEDIQLFVCICLAKHKIYSLVPQRYELFLR